MSRQAVSKWETAAAIPDLEVLLKISKLFHLTVNDLLEPDIQPQRITDFEQIVEIPEKVLREIRKQFDANSIVTALMGASPEVNGLCEKVFSDIDFARARNSIGRVKVEVVADMQKQMVSMINMVINDGYYDNSY